MLSPTNNETSQNMSETSNLLLWLHNVFLLGAAVGNKGQPVRDLQCSGGIFYQLTEFSSYLDPEKFNLDD